MISLLQDEAEKQEALLKAEAEKQQQEQEQAISKRPASRSSQKSKKKEEKTAVEEVPMYPRFKNIQWDMSLTSLKMVF